MADLKSNDSKINPGETNAIVEYQDGNIPQLVATDDQALDSFSEEHPVSLLPAKKFEPEGENSQKKDEHKPSCSSVHKHFRDYESPPSVLGAENTPEEDQTDIEGLGYSETVTTESENVHWVEEPPKIEGEEDGEESSTHIAQDKNTSATDRADVEAEEYDELLEDYEEEIEVDGEIKIVLNTRIVRKPKADNLKEKTEEGGEVNEFKESIDKIHTVDSENSFEEGKEEYELEDLDENGIPKIVSKKRKVRVPRRISIARDKLTTTGGYGSVIEENDEETVSPEGSGFNVKQKRVVTKPKDSTLDDQSQRQYDNNDEEEEGKVGNKDEGEVEDKIELEEEEEIEEEEEMEEQEEEEDEEDNEIVEEEGIEMTEESQAVKCITAKENKKMVKKKGRRKKPTALSERDEETHKPSDDEEGVENAEDITSEHRKLAEEKEEKEEISALYESLLKLRSENTILRKRNIYITSKLIQYLRKQKMEHVYTTYKEGPDHEIRFQKMLKEFYNYNQNMTEKMKSINIDWENQRAINEELAAVLKERQEELKVQKREVSTKLIDQKTGKSLSHSKIVDDLLIRQENQLKQLSVCRLSQIKLKFRIEKKKAERQVSGASFRLMDYEKLASLREFYGDKITERDVEINEISKKMSDMEEKLYTVKLQLHVSENELDQEQAKLQAISLDLQKKKTELHKIKAFKYKMEKNTSKVKSQSGLLAYPLLLKDYEEKLKLISETETIIENLKEQYRNGEERMEKLKEKIRRKKEARAFPEFVTFKNLPREIC